MDCNCEQLSDLREKSDRIKDLGEDLGKRIESDPVDIFSISALFETVKKSFDYSEQHEIEFLRACKDGRIYAIMEGIKLSPEQTHLNLVSEKMFQIKQATYYCTNCDGVWI